MRREQGLDTPRAARLLERTVHILLAEPPRGDGPRPER